MAFDNENAKNQLLALLRQSRRALLLVGSGSSRLIGYPSWPGLLEELRAHVVPELTIPPELDLLQRASLIRNSIDGLADHVDRLRLYRQFLESRFRPLVGTANHAPIHRTLVQLPFCGFATTNYDPVLEHAVTYVRVHEGQDCQCEAIDLCDDDRRHRVFEFLRSLTDDGPAPSVLHIHGFWASADRLVLTSEDYEKHYGLRRPEQQAGDPLAVPGGILDTLHRKVVWSLLTMRPIVFVGFSMEDPAFRLMLDIVHDDFKLAPTAVHFALLGSRSDEERERIGEFLRHYGVWPVFYEVIDDGAGNEDHTGMTTLIEELGAMLGVAGATPTAENITRRLLER